MKSKRRIITIEVETDRPLSKLKLAREVRLFFWVEGKFVSFMEGADCDGIKRISFKSKGKR